MFQGVIAHSQFLSRPTDGEFASADTLFRTDEVRTGSVAIGNVWAANPLTALAGPLHPLLDLLAMPGQPCLIHLAQNSVPLDHSAHP